MTKPTFRLGLVMAALTLAACTSQPNDAAPTETPRATLPSGATTEGTKGEPAVGTEPCDLAPYRDLVGTDVKATSFPDDPRVRVFNLNDIVTRDYIPQRTNIVHDNAGRITQVYCG